MNECFVKASCPVLNFSDSESKACKCKWKLALKLASQKEIAIMKLLAALAAAVMLLASAAHALTNAELPENVVRAKLKNGLVP